MILAALLVSSACSDEQATGTAADAGATGDAGAGDSAAGAAGSADPGALVHVTATSKVGVLLDEVPDSIRERVAAALIAKPDSFYEARAKQQLTLSTYRLNFRSSFYDEDSGKNQLPLPPPEVQAIQFVKTRARPHIGRPSKATTTCLPTTSSTPRSSPI